MNGAEVTIFCAGNVSSQGFAAWEALQSEGQTVRLISSAHWADFDLADLKSIAEFGAIVTVEDHNVNNGIGSSLAAELFAAGLSAKMTRLGVDQYGASGKATDVYRAAGIDAGSIADAVRALMHTTAGESVSA